VSFAGGMASCCAASGDAALEECSRIIGCSGDGKPLGLMIGVVHSSPALAGNVREGIVDVHEGL